MRLTTWEDSEDHGGLEILAFCDAFSGIPVALEMKISRCKCDWFKKYIWENIQILNLGFFGNFSWVALGQPCHHACSAPLRHLDSDLSAILKSGEPPVFERIPFILEDRSLNALLFSKCKLLLNWILLFVSTSKSNWMAGLKIFKCWPSHKKISHEMGYNIIWQIIHSHCKLVCIIISVNLCWEAQGKMMIDYVASHQDRSKNALLKSIEATYLAWVEDLRADQAQFVSDRILNLRL